jgi:hypothetical protein
MKNKNFYTFKGIVIGMLLTVLLSGTVVMASPQLREVVFGVNVSVNGQAVQFDADMRPFIMDGRTFLPVRAIADIAGLGVGFDSATNTVLLTNDGSAVVPPPPPARERTPLITAAPYYERNSSLRANGFSAEEADAHIAFRDVTMGGTTYVDALRFMSLNSNPGGVIIYTPHNLDGRYNLLTGHLGSIDGMASFDITVRFYGDNVLLQSYSLTAGAPPIQISVPVTGVRTLRIEFVYPRVNGNETHYALSAFLE